MFKYNLVILKLRNSKVHLKNPNSKLGCFAISKFLNDMKLVQKNNLEAKFCTKVFTNLNDII